MNIQIHQKPDHPAVKGAFYISKQVAIFTNIDITCDTSTREWRKQQHRSGSSRRQSCNMEMKIHRISPFSVSDNNSDTENKLQNLEQVHGKLVNTTTKT